MDPLRLLSRSTNNASRQARRTDLPSSGPASISPSPLEHRHERSSPKRRKIDQGPQPSGVSTNGLEYFSNIKQTKATKTRGKIESTAGQTPPSPRLIDKASGEDVEDQWRPLPMDERKRLLKQYKIRVTWLHSHPLELKQKRHHKDGAQGNSTTSSIFPSPLLSFTELVSRFTVSPKLASTILEQGFRTPTEVQLGALPLLLDDPTIHLPEHRQEPTLSMPEYQCGVDLLTVAPTGSGKTLAYLIPALHRLHSDKRSETATYRHSSVLILAPTRELASQIANEGRKLVRGTGVRVTQMRKGMRLGPIPAVGGTDAATTNVVKADVLVSTPGAVQSVLVDDSGEKARESIRYLILDEADVLLDPLFREQTLDIWNSLSNPNLRVSMWSATMGSSIEELATSTITARRQRLRGQGTKSVPEAPLIRLIVGLKDSAVPNVQHKLTYAASEQGKLMGLRELLHPTTSSIEAGPTLRPPFLVFTQTIERAIALHAELLYDIPSEAGGIDRIAVLHSDLSDTARDNTMTRFRKGEIWVLITTDLLSRGVDFLGVNGIVNYDIPTSSAAYVHRIGRTGRAGRTGGVAVTLYSKEDIPYLKHIANIVSLAQKDEGGNESMNKWLLNVIPKLSKNEKQTLRKYGIESRTTRGKKKDSKAARRTQISSKSGYDRRMENKRRGASKARKTEMEANGQSSDDEMSGFDGFDQ